MKHEDLRVRWKAKVAEWKHAFAHDNREHFSAGDFPHAYGVSVMFEDGSAVTFRYAILIEAPEWKEIGVFTGHCGYHLFPLGGAQVVRIES